HFGAKPRRNVEKNLRRGVFFPHPARDPWDRWLLRSPPRAPRNVRGSLTAAADLGAGSFPRDSLEKARLPCQTPEPMARHPIEEKLRGVFTALVTPFSEDGRKIDRDAFSSHVERQVEAAVSGLVVCGTTGETPTLLASEMQELVSVAKSVAGSRVPVVAGTCNNDTWDTIELCKGAVQAGADMLMIVSPYYNKP